MTDDFTRATTPLTDPRVGTAMSTESGPSAIRGVIFDWGGVLTPSLDGAMSHWAERDGADVDHFRAVLRKWLRRPMTTFDPEPTGERPVDRSDPAEESPVHRLERGEMDVREFEEHLAAELSLLGTTVHPAGLRDRLLAGLNHLDERMLGLVRHLRDAGFTTGLLSNSWGDHYPDRLWQGLFDAIVISGRVGMRKPEERIFRYAAGQLSLEPSQCVMIDDIVGNVVGAAATGMVGIVHVSWDETLNELEAVLGLELRGADLR